MRVPKGEGSSEGKGRGRGAKAVIVTTSPAVVDTDFLIWYHNNRVAPSHTYVRQIPIRP